MWAQIPCTNVRLCIMHQFYVSLTLATVCAKKARLCFILFWARCNVKYTERTLFKASLCSIFRFALFILRSMRYIYTLCMCLLFPQWCGTASLIYYSFNFFKAKYPIQYPIKLSISYNWLKKHKFNSTLSILVLACACITYKNAFN